MRNIQLVVAYDGTAYLGWQKTAMGPSIQETLQNVLEKILQEQICLQAASRTDAGVHALGQSVNFFTEKKINLDRLQISLACLLPKDIAVIAAKERSLSFHPTLDCIGKEYHYFLCTSTAQLPQHRLYSWHFPRPLQIEKMREASSYLVGEHDFSSFCNQKKNSAYKDYIRKVATLTIDPLKGKRLIIKVKGNHFLYKMVRNIVGTLVYVGSGKMTAQEVQQALQACSRSLAGLTAPAHGLTLAKVFYRK